MILSEGKRDNQLLPYLEAMNAKTGKNMSLGEFKTMMLRKLSTEGSINNLSLQSNYYLVGAVKYYFQGYLTLNKDLSVYSNKENAQDTWNREVCQKLNILVLMFRNGYIDSVGASWMEPEDFGEMSLPDLFKKYNAELKKVFSKLKKSEKEQEKKPIFLGSETQIGNGYTADIIYSFSDSSRYKDATSPGAWCITYGENHLNYYTNRGNGHFVIFRKNGYEGVERKPNKNQWVGDKPQDDYGNSLIAYLQSNTGPGPANYDGGPLITSRWNHGYEFSCEADRAYSQADFERITGIGIPELQKIYEEWKYYKDIKNNKKTKSDQLTDDLIRKVKYAQMRINGGEDPNVLLRAFDIHGSLITKDELCVASLKSDPMVKFILDGRKISIESIAYTNNYYRPQRWNQRVRDQLMYYDYNVTIKGKEYKLIYSRRRHQLCHVGDVYFFKGIPKNFETGLGIGVLKIRFAECVLYDFKKDMPIRLPNGQYWFNEIHQCSSDEYKSNKIEGKDFDSERPCEIVYDSSSREKYFFFPSTKRFIEIPQEERNGVRYEPILVEDCTTQDYLALMFITQDILDDGSIYSYRQRGIMYYTYKSLSPDKYYCKYYHNGQPYDVSFEYKGVKYTFGENMVFSNSVTSLSNKLNCIKINSENIIPTEYGHKSPYLYFNLDLKQLLLNPYTGEPLACEDYNWHENLLQIDCGRYSKFTDRSFYELKLLFDLRTFKPIENPANFPDKYQFYANYYFNPTGYVSFAKSQKTIDENPTYDDMKKNSGNGNYFFWLDEKTLEFSDTLTNES